MLGKTNNKSLLRRKSEGTAFTTTINDENNDEESTLAHAETSAVFWSRLLVISVLLIATVVAAVWVLVFVTKSDEEAFVQQVDDDITKIFDQTSRTMKQTLSATDSFMVGMSAYAAGRSKDTNVTWPFVSMSDFAVRASKARSLSKAFVMSTYPLVKGEERQQWEEFSDTHNQWVNQG